MKTGLIGLDEFQFADLPLALVVAPTRELALQVKRELTWLYGEAGGKIVSCVGGMDSRDERRALSRGAHSRGPGAPRVRVVLARPPVRPFRRGWP